MRGREFPLLEQHQRSPWCYSACPSPGPAHSQTTDQILEAAVGVLYGVQERIRGDGAVSGIGNGRTDEPDRPSVAASRVLLTFSAAVIGLKLVVELSGCQDNGSSIGSEPVLLANGREYRGTCRVSGIGRLYEPEVSNDPHTQQIVTE